MGRRKGRNLYITGPANCGKAFILDPQRVIYKTFVSPATCSYAWLGVEETEVIFLNDFRYTPAILPWNDMLLLLEGHVVHIAAPKNSYARGIEFTFDTPVFATPKSSIVLIKGSTIDEKETEMMDVRWRKFHFFHQIPNSSQKTATPCGCCFARLLLDADRWLPHPRSVSLFYPYCTVLSTAVKQQTAAYITLCVLLMQATFPTLYAS